MPKGITDLPSTTAQQIPSTEKENIAVNKAAKPRAQNSPEEAAQSTPLIARTSRVDEKCTPSQPLFEALDQNDMTAFSELIKGFDPANVAKLQNKDGQTITHQAVKNQNIEAFLLLRAANDGAPLAGITNQQGESVNDYITQQGEDFATKLTGAVQGQNMQLHDLRAQKLFIALEKNDMAQFKNLIDKLDHQRLGSLRNAEGQTITHCAIQNQNLEAFLLLRKANEGALGGIRNDKGETVSDFIQQQPAAFKEKLSAAIQEQSKSLGVTQTLLLEKAHAFLTYRLEDLKKQNLPTEHVEELDSVIKAVQIKGHCNGFALCWAEMFLLDMEKDYYAEVSLLRDWDEQKDTITPALTNMIDTLFQRVLFYQFGRGSVDQQIGQGDDLLLPSRQTSPISLFIDNPDFIFPIERLTIKSDLIPVPLLTSLLQEGATLQIGTLATHSIAVGMKKGAYYLFDSNYKGDETDFKQDTGAVQFNSIEALSADIRHRAYGIFKKDPKRFPGYTLSVMDLKASNHTYPTKAKVQQDIALEKINENKSLSPIEKFSLLIGKEINDHRVLFETLNQIPQAALNQARPEGFAFKTTLSEVVESDHPLKHEIIEFLLKKGVPIIYPEASLHILETALQVRDRKAINLILQFHPEAAETISEDYKYLFKFLTEGG